VIARIAPLLGLEPRYDLAPSDKLILASAGAQSAPAERTGSIPQRKRAPHPVAPPTIEQFMPRAKPEESGTWASPR
jgi:hypothetical protein